MHHTLQRLGKIRTVEPPGPSKFVKPYSIMYELDGKERRWDATQSHESVGVLLYNRDEDAMVLVRQFRPAVWAWGSMQAEKEGRERPPLSAGFSYELCAGLVDKSKSLKEIASEEVAEETGYDVTPEMLKPLSTYNSSVGSSGSLHHIFTCDVSNQMHTSYGGGVEGDGEAIEVLLLPLSNALQFAADDSLPKSAAMLFGIMYLSAREKRQVS